MFDPSAMDPFESPWRPQSGPGEAPQAPAKSSISAPAVIPGRIDPSVTADFNAQIAAFEMRLIDEALAVAQGHQGRAADALGLTYHQFRGLLKKHDYGKKPGKPKEEEGTPLKGAPRPGM
ncbi:MAG: helix-turn-helix domain-containing protein [Hyphomonas sp.]